MLKLFNASNLKHLFIRTMLLGCKAWWMNSTLALVTSLKVEEKRPLNDTLPEVILGYKLGLTGTIFWLKIIGECSKGGGAKGHLYPQAQTDML